MSICQPRLLSVLALALAFGFAAPREAASQHVDRLVRRAGDAASRELERKIEELARNGVRCVFDDVECIQKAKASGKTPVMTTRDGTLMTDDDGVPVTDPKVAAAKAGPAASAGAAEGARPGEGAWANYDFIPGERVLFADDFGLDNVGDFPRRLVLVSGNWEVVEWEGRRLLRNTGPRHAAVNVVLPAALPDRFTIELDVHFPHHNQQLVVSTEDNSQRPQGNAFQIARNGTGVVAGAKSKVSSTAQTLKTIESGLTPVRIMVDGRYAKVYVNERRVANVPNAEFVRGTVIQLRNSYFADEANPMLIAGIRIAAGGRDLYDALARDGRVATQGILFAVGSDVIRPESTPTLKEIGEMLREHGDLRLSIEGHTDSDGETAYNQELSDRRAAAVKAYLVGEYGIGASRLESVGFGESKPVASNDTPEGKQQNRRVELVKLGG